MTETNLMPFVRTHRLFVLSTFLFFKVTCRLVQHFGDLQNMKIKLYSNMKNFEELWMCLFQVSNSIRETGTSAQLVSKKWMDVERAWKRWGCGEVVTQR